MKTLKSYFWGYPFGYIILICITEIIIQSILIYFVQIKQIWILFHICFWITGFIVFFILQTVYNLKNKNKSNGAT
jgi:hypothetical protein